MHDCECPLDEVVHVSLFVSFDQQVPLEVTESVTLKPKDSLFVKFELRKNI